MLETGTIALMTFKPSEPGKGISLPRIPMLPTVAFYFGIFMWTNVMLSQIHVEKESPLRKLDWNDNDGARELPREVASSIHFAFETARRADDEATMPKPRSCYQL